MVVCLIKSLCAALRFWSSRFVVLLRLESSTFEVLFLFNSFLKNSPTSVVRLDPDEISSRADEAADVTVEGVADVAKLMYFLKYSASSSTTISSLNVFF